MKFTKRIFKNGNTRNYIKFATGKTVVLSPKEASEFRTWVRLHKLDFVFTVKNLKG